LVPFVLPVLFAAVLVRGHASWLASSLLVPGRAKINEGAPMRRKINAVLDEIRPYLQSDGGDVTLVDYVDGEVKVRLIGACSGCPSSTATLKNGIERRLKEALPEVEIVTSV